MQVITEQSTSVYIRTACSLPLSPKTLSPSLNLAVFLFATLLLGFRRCISEPPVSCLQKAKAVSSVTVTVYKIQQSSFTVPAKFLIYQNVSVYTNTRDGGQKKKTSSRHPLWSKHVVSVTIFIMLLNVFLVYGNVKTILLLLQSVGSYGYSDLF